jgi:hypothetical protein
VVLMVKSVTKRCEYNNFPQIYNLLLSKYLLKLK